jgi:hypothetical protein
MVVLIAHLRGEEPAAGQRPGSSRTTAQPSASRVLSPAHVL